MRLCRSADTTTAQFHDALAKLARTSGRAGFAIVQPETNALAGNIAASLRADDETTAEISYWLAAEARGHGLATEAVRVFTCSASRQLRRSRLRQRREPHQSAALMTHWTDGTTRRHGGK